MYVNPWVPDWTIDVIDFLSLNLPPSVGGEGWDHMFTTAYEIGCEALVALGHAKEAERGAIARQTPQLPEILPRWDDVCVAVLWLAEQQGKLAYRLPDGSVPPSRGDRIVIVGAPPPPEPNIAAAHGLGLAYATPEGLSILESLGLIAEDSWTKAAETVLWRDQPRAWGMDVTSDPRFSDAVEQACDTIPDDIRAEMRRLGTITEADVAAAVARSAAQHDEMRAKYGPKARIGSPATSERARNGLAFVRRSELDWLFFRRWRLADGWLTPEEATWALAIFHDRLAIAMRRAVIARLYPSSSFLAE